MLGVQALGPVLPRFAAGEAGEEEFTVSPARHSAAKGTTDAGMRDRIMSAAAERDAWVVLLSVSGLGPVSFGALLGAFGSARTVLEAATGPDGPARLLEALYDAAPDRTQVQAVFDTCAEATGDPSETPPVEGRGSSRRRPAIGADLAARICEAALDGGRRIERVRALGLDVVTLEDAAYPQRLRQVELPPPLLFVRGSAAALSAKFAVAVVGTRRPTDKGRLIAGWIGSAVARTGAVVVSGLAVGIDGAAHAAVVAEGRATVAVLGGGHARLFPTAHERLAEAIVEAGGAVVSELAPDTSPSRGTFPRRNRLVSGLSDATVVVEAGRRSGALITAGWALEQGRECFLVPGPFDSPASAGCHAFLRTFPGQARLVSGVAELIEDLGLDGGVAAASEDGSGYELGNGRARRGEPSSSARAPGRDAVLASLGQAERAVAQELTRGPATADQLAARTSLAGAAVLSALTLLELRGLTTCGYGRYAPSGPLAGWCGVARSDAQPRSGGGLRSP